MCLPRVGIPMPDTVPERRRDEGRVGLMNTGTSPATAWAARQICPWQPSGLWTGLALVADEDHSASFYFNIPVSKMGFSYCLGPVLHSNPAYFLHWVSCMDVTSSPQPEQKALRGSRADHGAHSNVSLINSVLPAGLGLGLQLAAQVLAVIESPKRHITLWHRQLYGQQKATS